jgi:hypothetical protein
MVGIIRMGEKERISVTNFNNFLLEYISFIN